MKKIYLIFFICIAFLGTRSATFTVNVVGFTYSPSTLTVAVGDKVIFQPGGHPTAQVSPATWSANGTATLAGGWGSTGATFTYNAVGTGTVYYVCQAHVSSGMKGMITVVSGVGVNETATNFLNQFNLFPNPATDHVKVSFTLNETSNVNIKLFNVIGQEIKTFESNLNLNSGSHDYYFDLPSGISTGNYFIEVSSGNIRSIKKLLVTK